MNINEKIKLLQAHALTLRLAYGFDLMEVARLSYGRLTPEDVHHIETTPDTKISLTQLVALGDALAVNLVDIYVEIERSGAPVVYPPQHFFPGVKDSFMLRALMKARQVGRTAASLKRHLGIGGMAVHLIQKSSAFGDRRIFRIEIDPDVMVLVMDTLPPFWEEHPTIDWADVLRQLMAHHGFDWRVENRPGWEISPFWRSTGALWVLQALKAEVISAGRAFEILDDK